MERRRFLAASVAATALPLAGCAARETTLQDPEVRREDDETHLVYRDGDERIAEVSYVARQRTGSPPPYGLWFHVAHAESLSVDAFRVELDVAPSDQSVGSVYLEAPDGAPYPEMHYHTEPESGSTVVDVDDTESQGSGAVNLGFLVASSSEPPVAVVGDASLTLIGRRFVGDRYELSDRVEFELGR